MKSFQYITVLGTGVLGAQLAFQAVSSGFEGEQVEFEGVRPASVPIYDYAGAIVSDVLAQTTRRLHK